LQDISFVGFGARQTGSPAAIDDFASKRRVCHAFGVEEAEPPRTSSAWMMLDLVLALRQVVILAWVNFCERKWVILR
jgi:hypothetical protein